MLEGRLNQPPLFHVAAKLTAFQNPLKSARNRGIIGIFDAKRAIFRPKIATPFECLLIGVSLQVTD